MQFTEMCLRLDIVMECMGYVLVLKVQKETRKAHLNLIESLL